MGENRRVCNKVCLDVSYGYLKSEKDYYYRVLKMQNKQILFEAMVNLDEEKARKIVKDKISFKILPELILKELQNSMLEIGNRFEREEYFVPELIFAGEIMKDIVNILKPHLTGKSIEDKPKVIVGTVFGDVHDIGKDIVAALLDGTGFKVIDLGVNVEPSSFIKAIEDSKAKLVGMSALLTMAFTAISNTVDAIKKAGLRDKVSIMAGGAPVTELVCKKTGCDFYGKNAFEGVKIAKEVYGQ